MNIARWHNQKSLRRINTPARGCLISSIVSFLIMSHKMVLTSLKISSRSCRLRSSTWRLPLSSASLRRRSLSARSMKAWTLRSSCRWISSWDKMKNTCARSTPITAAWRASFIAAYGGERPELIAELVSLMTGCNERHLLHLLISLSLQHQYEVFFCFLHILLPSLQSVNFPKFPDELQLVFFALEDLDDVTNWRRWMYCMLCTKTHANVSRGTLKIMSHNASSYRPQTGYFFPWVASAKRWWQALFSHPP